MYVDTLVRELGEPGAEALLSLEEVYRLTRDEEAGSLNSEGQAGLAMLRAGRQRATHCDAAYIRGRIQDYWEHTA